jgi:hypothetical protein
LKSKAATLHILSSHQKKLMQDVISMRQWLEQKQENQESDKRLFLIEKEINSLTHYRDATDEEIKNIIVTLHDLSLLVDEVFCREACQGEYLNKAA